MARSSFVSVVLLATAVGCGEPASGPEDPDGGSTSADAGPTGWIDSGPPAADAAAPDRCTGVCDRAAECGVPGLDGVTCAADCRERVTEDQITCLEACGEGSCDGYGRCADRCGRPETPGDPYGGGAYHCTEEGGFGPECGSDVRFCLAHLDLETSIPTESVCTPDCVDGACPAPSSGTVAPVCVTGDTGAVCLLDCTGGGTCPDGMGCLEDDSGPETRSLCMWRPPAES